MKTPWIIRIFVDGKLDREFQTLDDSWQETRFIKIHESGKIFTYSSPLSEKGVISFVYNSETITKEAFNLDSLEMAGIAS